MRTDIDLLKLIGLNKIQQMYVYVLLFESRADKMWETLNQMEKYEEFVKNNNVIFKTILYK